ncbi:MAG: multidrug ABC transporter ATP-binding protein [Oceanospirillum sp.]|nr:multidrug ABC transporter ATP-binding protein [Oceanospirillum sp.]
MLEVKQLSCRFGAVQAVHQVSFNIGKGEIVGLLGHNGAGKTTLMKMICGYTEPDQGCVLLDQQDLNTQRALVQRKIGYLPENLPVYPEMQVVDYLDYAAELKGLTGPEKQQAIQQAVTATDLADRLLTPIANLSRGYKQRVGVAQAILGQPELLILDEPTNGLDPEQTQLMRQLIRQIAQHATVILSTHIMQEVEALCSRVLIINQGRLAMDADLPHLYQSAFIQVDTNSPETVINSLRQHPDIQHISHRQSQLASQPEQAPNQTSLRIELKPGVDVHTLCADIAEHIVAQGYRIYRLQPEKRDLESLFRSVEEPEINREGVNHAA